MHLPSIHTSVLQCAAVHTKACTAVMILADSRSMECTCVTKLIILNTGADEPANAKCTCKPLTPD